MCTLPVLSIFTRAVSAVITLLIPNGISAKSLPFSSSYSKPESVTTQLSQPKAKIDEGSAVIIFSKE